MEKGTINGVQGRNKTLWSVIDEKWVAHMLGISLRGRTGVEAKEFLKIKKVWPYYIPDVNDENDFDNFPLDLLPEFDDKESVYITINALEGVGLVGDSKPGHSKGNTKRRKKKRKPKFVSKLLNKKIRLFGKKKKQRSLYGNTRKPL